MTEVVNFDDKKIFEEYLDNDVTYLYICKQNNNIWNLYTYDEDNVYNATHIDVNYDNNNQLCEINLEKNGQKRQILIENNIVKLDKITITNQLNNNEFYCELESKQLFENYLAKEHIFKDNKSQQLTDYVNDDYLIKFIQKEKEIQEIISNQKVL